MAGIKENGISPLGHTLTFASHKFLIYVIVFVLFSCAVSSPFAALLALAFAGSIGMTFVILGCALPQYGIWWPFFVVLMYVLSPIPTLISRRHMEDSMGSGNTCLELAIFLTMGIIVSAFGLPIVLARAPTIAPTIQWGACYLTLAGNVVVFLTLLGFFLTFDLDDSDYSLW